MKKENQKPDIPPEWAERYPSLFQPGASTAGKAGRPAKMRNGKKVNIYIDEESLALARRIGNGNVSEGIRLALALAGGMP